MIENLNSTTDRDRRPDSVELNLLQAMSIIDSAVVRYRATMTERSLEELPPDDATMRLTSIRLAESTRWRVACVFPAGTGSSELLEMALAVLPTLVDRGVTTRMLCSPSAMHSDRGLEFVQAADRHTPIRIAESPLQELLIIDNRVALLRAVFDTAGPQTLIVRVPALVRTLSALHTSMWATANSVADHTLTSRRLGSPITQSILDSLRCGHKDDVAARQLGLSVRTYRRHVADLLRDLGAASRFQAGVRAAELGLYSTPRAKHGSDPTAAVPPSFAGLSRPVRQTRAATASASRR